MRRATADLPGVTERDHFGGPAFAANGRDFAVYWSKEHRWVMKLPQPVAMMLFDSRPETFSPMRSGRMLLSYVKIKDLAAAELADLLREARRTVTPARQQTHSAKRKETLR